MENVPKLFSLSSKSSSLTLEDGGGQQEQDDGDTAKRIQSTAV